MSVPNQLPRQINRLVGFLIETGLSDDQQAAFLRQRGRNRIETTFQGAGYVSVALRDRAYSDIYRNLVGARAYNAKMLDGALLQMMYLFDNGILHRHRLAFFPSPHLEEFQNNPEIYLEDERYADVVARNIVPFPLRFDFDASERTSQNHLHPKSHVTLGQYENCRIPVTAPLTPVRFVEFILRNFYYTAFSQVVDKYPGFGGSFADSITQSERRMVHIVIP